MKLYELFERCLTVSYKKAGKAANFATQREGERLYLFFEDSDGKIDWKNNLDFPLKPYKRMGKTVWFAHRGFLRVWKEIEPLLTADITDTSVREIVVAGYSHGGALAMLCHEYVWYHRPDLHGKIYGFGFGAPRVYWGVRTKTLLRRWDGFTVVRNIDDLVTHLPPAILGYSHVGKLLKVGEWGKYARIEAHYAANIARELQVYDETSQ